MYAGIGAGLAAIGAEVSVLVLSVAKGMVAIARQPEAVGDIRNNMLIWQLSLKRLHYSSGCCIVDCEVRSKMCPMRKRLVDHRAF